MITREVSSLALTPTEMTYALPLRASTISEGEQFNVTSREGALVMNNVLLSATLGVILIGTLYPLVAESLGAKVSVGPPYFNPMSAVFIIPMLVVMAIGPLLRWRHKHVFKAVSGGQTQVNDQIEYQHRPGLRHAWTRLLYSPPMLRVLFAYRAWATRRALKNQSPGVVK